MFITSFYDINIYIHTHIHKTQLNRVVDETARGYGLGAKRLGGKWYLGGETTKSKKK